MTKSDQTTGTSTHVAKTNDNANNDHEQFNASAQSAEPDSSSEVASLPISPSPPLTPPSPAPSGAAPASALATSNQSTSGSFEKEWMLWGTLLLIVAMFILGYKLQHDKVKLLTTIYICNSGCQMLLDYYKGEAKAHFSAACRAVALLAALLSLLG